MFVKPWPSPKRLVIDFPAVPMYRLHLVSSHHRLGHFLARLGQQTEAEKQFRQARTLNEKLVGDFPAVPKYRQELAMNYTDLGVLLWRLGKRGGGAAASPSLDDQAKARR